jgi:ABC-type iron transport system FetAB permease component
MAQADPDQSAREAAEAQLALARTPYSAFHSVKNNSSPARRSPRLAQPQCPASLGHHRYGQPSVVGAFGMTPHARNKEIRNRLMLGSTTQQHTSL